MSRCDSRASGSARAAWRPAWDLLTDAPAPRSVRSRWRRVAWLVVGWIISGVILVQMLRIVPLREAWSALASMHPAYVAAAVAATLVSLMLRGVRWAMMFSPQHAVDRGSATAMVMVGLALNAVLPGRIGDFARRHGAQRASRPDFDRTSLDNS